MKVQTVALKLSTPRVFAPLYEKKARYRAAWGGRGSGKSHAFAEMLVERAVTVSGLRAVCVREVQKSLKDSVKKLVEDKIEAMGVGHLFEVLATEIRTPGGGLIIFQGMQDHTAESIKSLEGFDIAWVEEAQSLSSRSLELLRPTIRKPGSEIWFTWNPKSAHDPVDQFLRQGTPPANAIIIKANYYDNPFLPPELDEERSDDERRKPERYRHIWMGEYEPAAIGAIWDRVTLHRYRVHEPPTLGRIVVAVDPAVSASIGSNEHGIIVAGAGEDGRGYVLADFSGIGTPQQWARRAVAAFDRYDADAVVVERNQGGDMVAATLKTIRPTLPIVEVVATRGKFVRAEPISALYTLGQISHVGTFAELEEQMCLITAGGYEGEGSPDRADALVWALTELFPNVIGHQRQERREKLWEKRLRSKNRSHIDPMAL